MRSWLSILGQWAPRRWTPGGPRRDHDLTVPQAYGLLFVISLVWAGNFLAAKAALAIIGPITLTALRAVLASGFLLWYVRLTHQTWPLVGGADLRTFVILALTGLVSSSTLWYYGVRSTLAVNAAILGAMGPIFVGLLSAAWLRERLSRLNVLGIGLSTAGVVLTVVRTAIEPMTTLEPHVGDFFILAGQAAWAVYSVYSRQIARHFSPTVITTGAYLVSCTILVPLALVERPWTTLTQLTPGAVLGVLYAAIVVTISHVWFYWGMRVISATVASLTVNVIPFEVLLLSWLWLDEPIGWVHVLGALIVIVGVLLATQRDRAPDGTTTAPPGGQAR